MANVEAMATTYRAKLAASFGGGGRMFTTTVALVVAAIVALNLYAPAEPTLLQRGLASLLVALCALPSLLWSAERPWHHSLMPYAGVLYAVHFAAPIFVRRDFFGSWYAGPFVDETAIDNALLLALAGWVALMVGYFAIARTRAAAVLPCVSVLPNDARLAKSVAVVVGVAAMPFLYLDNAAVVAYYVGEPTLPEAIAFPVALAGQFVVFAILVLFFLHLRGQLGVAGRIFLTVLAIYYTILGLSTGMVNHGVKAVFALFMAYAVVAPTPTWRGIAYGTVTAAILLFVLVPTRYEYRRLIWTHGVDAHETWRLTTHHFDPQDGDDQVLEAPLYRISLRDGRIAFAHKDPAVCNGGDAESASLAVFVHVDPTDPDDLPQVRRQYGFGNLDFSFLNGTIEDGRCVQSVRLPDYEIRAIRTGLFRTAEPAGPKIDLLGRRELATAVRVGERVDEDGEWRLGTRDSSTWQIDRSLAAASQLAVAVATDDDRTLADRGIGRIVVEVDEDNWAEYEVSQVSANERRVAYRLSALLSSEGNRAKLTEGASALLRYQLVGTVAATLGRERLGGVGRNPLAPKADYSLARKTTVYAESLTSVLDDERGTLRTADAIDRLDRLLPLAWLMRHTPEPVPFLRGETYVPLLFKLVPRAIFKDKPRDTSNMGQRYDFVPIGNQVNAFKVHQLGELYANFGGLGTLFGMFVLGALYCVLYMLFHRADASVVTMAAGTHMLTALMLDMESILSVSWGFILWYAVAVALLAVAGRLAWRIYTERWPKQSSPSLKELKEGEQGERDGGT